MKVNIVFSPLTTNFDSLLLYQLYKIYDNILVFIFSLLNTHNNIICMFYIGTIFNIYVYTYYHYLIHLFLHLTTYMHV